MPELGWVRAQSQGRRRPGPPEQQEGWPGHEVSSVSLAEPALWPGPSARERSVQGGWPCTCPSSWPQRPRPPGDSPPCFHTSARPQPQPTGQEPRPRLSLHVRPSERNSDVRPWTHRLRAEGSGPEGAGVDSEAFPGNLRSPAAPAARPQRLPLMPPVATEGMATPR